VSGEVDREPGRKRRVSGRDGGRTGGGAGRPSDLIEIGRTARTDGGKDLDGAENGTCRRNRTGRQVRRIRYVGEVEGG